MTIERQSPLADLTAYSEARYSNIDLSGLVAFCLKWLLDQNIATSFENVVVCAFRMFPAKFAMVGYPEYPDAARVNRSLLQLGPKYRNWTRGSVQKGFVLTDSGVVKVKEVESLLSSDHGGDEKQRRSTRLRTVDTEAELSRVIDSALFRHWALKRLEASPSLELLDMLGAYAYTPARALRGRLMQLENTAAQAGRADLLEFIADVRRVFRTQLEDG